VTERSGIGPVELSVLRAVEAEAARSPDGYMRCADVLPVIEQHTGIGPRRAYDILLDLAAPLGDRRPVDHRARQHGQP
jgi:hypothetical protein